jgi:hypothetical protein
MTRGSDSAPPGEHGPGYMQRRTARVDLAGAEASLSPPNLKVEIKVCNVSTAGFMAECAAPVRIGSNVSLDIPGIGKVAAQVRWQIGLKMGGMFLDPISLSRCEWAAEKAKAETV